MRPAIPESDMALDMFIDMGAIKGESRDKENKDKIDILAWSWG
jgi:type VI secretion system secreted protein Hcp